ncbi:MAG TPA: hypothetical protein VLK65_00815 [Vicinamibacteria bacterium]|nr:hypothetical protein [Vicinamibacteria bacterium]
MVLDGATQARAIYDANLDLIEKVVRRVARRNRLSADEAEQLRSDVHFKLLRDNCTCLGKLRHVNRLEPFLVVLATNELRDARIKKWGRWRPPTAVERMGRVAGLLYRQVDRNGCSMNEAIERVRSKVGLTISREELASVAARLPGTRQRRFVLSCEPDELPAPASVEEVESNTLRRELAPLARKARAALTKALSNLETEERILLKLFYLKGLRWSEIGRARAFDRKRIFRAKDSMHSRLQKALKAEGLGWDELEGMLNHRLLDMDLDEELDHSSESSEAERPTH